MGEALERAAIERWRQDPAAFITETMRDPETGRKFELLPSQRRFFDYAYRTGENGRLLYPEQGFCCPKKGGKSTLAAMHQLTTTLVFGGKFAEGYCVANDFEQAQGRVFLAARRIVEASPFLAREAIVKQTRIEFPATGATIQALASDYASAAGSAPSVSSFDELWGYTSERARRLWDEMIFTPTRKISCRLTTSYAGFSGESELLEDLHKRGSAQPEVEPGLHAGDGILFFWSNEPIAPWQDEAWLAEMRRSLRPNQYLRMIENRFVTSEENFVELSDWDACCTGRAVVADKSVRAYAAIDASVKRDSTAIVVASWDKATKRVRMLHHQIFQPSAGRPIDFEYTVEETLLDLRRRFALRTVLYDPYQMAASAQRLTRRGLKMEEFPQTVSNLTAASQNLYELIASQGLVAYPDNAVRLAISRAVALETSRGWRIAKEKQSHKIDVVIALGMASLAAVQRGESGFMRIGTYMIGGVGGIGKISWHDEEVEPLRLRHIVVNEKGEVVKESLSVMARDRKWVNRQ
jgi:phage terminase large subunit-like protein